MDLWTSHSRGKSNLRPMGMGFMLASLHAVLKGLMHFSKAPETEALSRPKPRPAPPNLLADTATTFPSLAAPYLSRFVRCFFRSLRCRQTSLVFVFSCFCLFLLSFQLPLQRAPKKRPYHDAPLRRAHGPAGAWAGRADVGWCTSLPALWSARGTWHVTGCEVGRVDAV